MKRFKCIIIFALFLGAYGNAQFKHEREHRIKKVQFPQKALQRIAKETKDAKRIKFYRETDGSKTSFEIKFKKDRLWYSIEFDEDGNLEDIEILIRPVDIPEDSYRRITTYLENNFSKYSIRRLQQQYPASEKEDVEKTLKDAFQNLMLPSIHYEIVISGKKETTFEQFEILFDADGNFKTIRKSLPPNYDHILY